MFCTKYRIHPLYRDEKLYGYIVYERAWCCPVFLGSTLDVITDGKLNNREKAAFKSMEEAIAFIKFRTTDYTYETIQAV